MNNKIFIFPVILHYGDPVMTQNLARELESGDMRIYVLDNGAPAAYDTQDQAFWQRLPNNLFWAGALEYAVQEAVKRAYTHLWFLNNDIRFLSNTPYIPRVYSRLQKIEKKIGSVGIYVPSVSKRPYHPQMVHKRDMAFSRVACVDGIAPLISLDMLKDIGGLDVGDNIHGYGVDMWLSLRAHRAGWQVVVDHGLEIRHDYHKTAKQIPGFLYDAAQKEDAYLCRRLGKNWREQLCDLQKYCIDKEVL